MNDEPRLPDDAPNPESLTEMEAKLAEMDARIADQRKASKEDIERIHAGFDEKLSELDQRLQTAQKKEQNRKATIQESGMGGGGTGKSLGVGLTVAYAIIGAPIAGYGAGWLIDRSLGISNAWSAGLTLFGAFAGVVFAVIVTQRHQK